MALRRIPVEIRRAMYAGDRETLSRAGKRGATVRRRNRRVAQKELSAKLAECEERAQQAHEDICPVDD